MGLLTDNIMIVPFIVSALITGVILFIVYTISKLRDK